MLKSVKSFIARHAPEAYLDLQLAECRHDVQQVLKTAERFRQKRDRLSENIQRAKSAGNEAKVSRLEFELSMTNVGLDYFRKKSEELRELLAGIEENVTIFRTLT